MIPFRTDDPDTKDPRYQEAGRLVAFHYTTIRKTPTTIECPYCRSLMFRLEGAKRYAITRIEAKGDMTAGCLIPAKYWVLACPLCNVPMCCPPPGRYHA